MSIPSIGSAAAAISQLVQNTPVVLLWNETTGGTANPVTGAVIGGTTTTRQETVYGSPHFAPASAVQRTHAEVQTGDCILDLAPDLVLTGRPGLRFVIGGRTYVPKTPSEALATSWDAVVGGVKLTQTVLLRLAA